MPKCPLSTLLSVLLPSLLSHGPVGVGRQSAGLRAMDYGLLEPQSERKHERVSFQLAQ